MGISIFRFPLQPSGRLPAVLAAFFVAAVACGKPKPVESRRSFREDSLKVRALLAIGDSIYAVRNGMATIEESMLFFDSANRMAERMGDTALLARTLFFIGNVYNAWNGEPQKTLEYYQRSADLFSRLPGHHERAFYLRYLTAHALDGEKGADTPRCLRSLQTTIADLNELPPAARDSLGFISDFAWVSTNVGAYNFAQYILDSLTHRALIRNDPESNNYLDHYYLTRARIDVYGRGDAGTPYLDSLARSLQLCNNRFDSAYYAENLARMYARGGWYRQAFEYQGVEKQTRDRLGNSTVLSVLQNELLARELEAQREREARAQEEIRNKNLYLYITGLLLLTVVLAVSLYLIYRKRRRARREAIRQLHFTQLLLQKEEDERRRIASDLHDGINHDLLALKNRLLLRQPVSATDLEAVTTSIREISRNLYPAMFESVGLVGSLEALCEGRTAAGLFCTCDIDYRTALSKRDELQLYRIVQEALTNVAKHADAEAAKVTVRSNNRELHMEVKDNGSGFSTGDEQAEADSFGLQSMKQRAKVLGAMLEIDSSQKGTRIILRKTFQTA